MHWILWPLTVGKELGVVLLSAHESWQITQNCWRLFFLEMLWVTQACIFLTTSLHHTSKYCVLIYISNAYALMGNLRCYHSLLNVLVSLLGMFHNSHCLNFHLFESQWRKKIFSSFYPFLLEQIFTHMNYLFICWNLFSLYISVSFSYSKDISIYDFSILNISIPDLNIFLLF